MSSSCSGNLFISGSADSYMNANNPNSPKFEFGIFDEAGTLENWCIYNTGGLSEFYILVDLHLINSTDFIFLLSNQNYYGDTSERLVMTSLCTVAWEVKIRTSDPVAPHLSYRFMAGYFTNSKFELLGQYVYDIWCLGTGGQYANANCGYIKVNKNDGSVLLKNKFKYSGDSNEDVIGEYLNVWSEGNTIVILMSIKHYLATTLRVFWCVII